MIDVDRFYREWIRSCQRFKTFAITMAFQGKQFCISA